MSPWRERTCDLETDMMRHPVIQLGSFNSVVWHFSPFVRGLRRKVSEVHICHCNQVSQRDLYIEPCIASANTVGTLRPERSLQSACSIGIGKLPAKTIRSALVVAEVMMLRKILEREGFAVLTEAWRLIKESHIDIDIVANIFVKPCWRS